MVGSTVSVERLLAQESWSLHDIIDLRHTIRQLVPERRRFEEHLRKGGGVPVPTVVVDWLLDRGEEFEEEAAASRDGLVMLLRAVNLAEAGRRLEAHRTAQKALRSVKDPWAPVVAAELALEAHRPEDAAPMVDKLLSEHPEDPYVLYLVGRLKEEELLWQEALEYYDKALAAEPELAAAAFRRAYLLDLRGAEEEAVEDYRTAAVGRARYAGAMVNLGLMYEERNDLERAIACYRQAARVMPRSHHARVLLEGAVESTQELFDEAERKEMERVQKLLRTPITEFELSVRSRNCLNRMGIRTLWDIVQKTEEELLAHKNFGEVSLREIKRLLASRGLRLGMRRDLSPQKAVREMLSSAAEGGATDPELLGQPVSSLELSGRAARALERLGVKTIGELVGYTEKELLSLPNFGQVSLQEVRSRLAQLGLSFKSEDTPKPALPRP